MRSPISWWEHGGQGGSAASTHDRGKRLLANLLQMPADEFVRDHWLQRPLLCRCKVSPIPASHPANMLPLAEVRALVHRKKPRRARFLHDVDVTKYINGKRQALSEGNEEVKPAAVWSAFEERGYSIRLVHPQQWHQASYELCSVLQEFFGFPVGCAAYLTPAGTQGFPPHYDDVEVFVLQLEGTKAWRLYDRPDTKTRPAADTTTECSGASLGEPTAEITLKKGDLLYLPRGVVHQALAQSDGHSLHLTFSTYQRHTWRDLLADPAVSHLLSSRATARLAALREEDDDPNGDGGVLKGDRLLDALPLDLLTHNTAGSPAAGWSACAMHLTPPRIPFWLTSELWVDGTLGAAIDARALFFLKHSLPPWHPTEAEEAAVRGAPAAESDTTPAVLDGESEEEALHDGSWLRACAPYCARLVDGAGTNGDLSSWESGETTPELALYTNVQNGRSFAESPSPAFEVLPHLARSVVALLEAGCEKGVEVGKLPAASGSDEEARADLYDLLELLVEQKVLMRMVNPGAVAAKKKKRRREREG